MSTTIKDVAKKLNLSITTVSRALDGYPDVSEATRKLVIQTSHEMGYTPNRAARQLRRQRTDTIGYIIPAISSGFADPFFSEFIAGLGDESSAHNYDLLVTTAAPESEEENALYRRWVQSGKIDGVVLNRMRLDDWRPTYLREQKIPFVSLERSLSQEDFVGIEVKSINGVLDLMKYIIGKGHSRIAYLGGSLNRLKIDHDRYTGYKEGLLAGAINFDPAMVVNTDLTASSGYHAALKLLGFPNPPTALVCINDMVAIGVMHAVHDKNLQVGQDIAVAGFDGILNSAYTQPPLTTLDQPVYEIARQLVKMLLGLINGEPIKDRQIIFEAQLLIRESTGK